ncbi:branched-chain-amino-acid aminotransferase-like protein 1 [Scenedesmus sp. PABB004]|nr:branched-chain-amino-acid aminotransferase-like protein 1 [Scenedesmus sp. PABB004]
MASSFKATEKYRCTLLSPDGGSERVTVQLSIEGLKILNADASRTMRSYNLRNVARWELMDTSTVIWTKTDVDLEERPLTLSSDPTTIRNVVDTLACCCMQLAEFIKDKEADHAAASNLEELAAGGGRTRRAAKLPSVDSVEYWRSPEKAGWLQSQSEVMKMWRRRWFVLKQGYLFRFLSPDVSESVKPRGVVDLSKVQDVRDGRGVTGKANTVQLKTSSGGGVCYVCESGASSGPPRARARPPRARAQRADAVPPAAPPTPVSAETEMVEWISALEGSVSRIVKQLAGVDDSPPPSGSRDRERHSHRSSSRSERAGGGGSSNSASEWARAMERSMSQGAGGGGGGSSSSRDRRGGGSTMVSVVGYDGGGGGSGSGHASAPSAAPGYGGGYGGGGGGADPYGGISSYSQVSGVAGVAGALDDLSLNYGGYGGGGGAPAGGGRGGASGYGAYGGGGSGGAYGDAGGSAGYGASAGANYGYGSAPAPAAYGGGGGYGGEAAGGYGGGGGYGEPGGGANGAYGGYGAPAQQQPPASAYEQQQQPAGGYEQPGAAYGGYYSQQQQQPQPPQQQQPQPGGYGQGVGVSLMDQVPSQQPGYPCYQQQHPAASQPSAGQELPAPAPAAAPAAPPGGWQVHATAEGRPYYYNPATNVTQWEAPPGMQLPAGPGAGRGAARQQMAAAAEPPAAAPVDRLCINCWSGPRCCSTSLMYAFAQRSDTQVLDEPLYASYLAITGAARPYRDLVLAAQDDDAHRVAASILGPRSKPVLYAKHISKHKVGLDDSLWKGATHVLLLREPYGVVQSFSKVLAPSLLELGYAALLEIYSELRALGRPPIVVLSDELVRHPEAMLRALCAALELPWQPSMLHWPSGPKPYDGVWSPWWYANTHKSTGFDFGWRDVKEPLPDRLKPLLGECWPAYELLRRHALKPLPADAVPRPLGAPRGQSSHSLRLTKDSDTPSASPRYGGGAARPGGALTLSVSADHATLAAAAERAGAAGRASLEDATGGAAPGAGGASSALGSHVCAPDPRNADVLVGVRDGVADCFDLVWRPQARVSVLDSGFLLGDGVWEGLRVVKGVVAFAKPHLSRLYEGAAALDMDIGLSPAALLGLVYSTLDANGMASASGVHVRLVVSRGLKATPYQAPAVTVGKPTVVILPEWKDPATGPRERGIRLFTTHVRRGPPDVQDPGWNSLSKLNCIAACIQASKAGADEALMLDPQGFVATCNSTNFFIVREGEVWVPRGAYLMRGVTRANVLRLCAAHGLPLRECDFYLTQVYGADEAFVTGTFAGVVPVVEVDGRRIGSGSRGPLTAQLQALYAAMVEADVAGGREAWRDDDDDDTAGHRHAAGPGPAQRRSSAGGAPRCPSSRAAVAGLVLVTLVLALQYVVEVRVSIAWRVALAGSGGAAARGAGGTHCRNSCPRARDGVCDEGRPHRDPRRAEHQAAAQLAQGMPAGTSAVHCDLGTDCADCGPWAGRQADEAWAEPLLPVALLRAANVSVRVRATSIAASPVNFTFAFTDPALDTDVSWFAQTEGLVEVGISQIFYTLLSKRCGPTGPGALVADVGANFGWFTLLAAHLGCRVVAWEPVPIFRALLSHNLARNQLAQRVDVRPTVVSHPPGSPVTVVVPNKGQWGTASIGGANFDPGSHDAKRGPPQEVAVVSEGLDDVLGNATVALLKVDVEGAEPAVLATAPRLLGEGRLANIVLEYSPGVYERSARWGETGLFPRMLLGLARANFTMAHLPDDFVRVWAPGRGVSVALPPLRVITPANLLFDVWETQTFRTGYLVSGAAPPFCSAMKRLRLDHQGVPERLHPKSFHAMFSHNTNVWASREPQFMAALLDRPVGIFPLNHPTNASWFPPREESWGLGGVDCEHLAREMAADLAKGGVSEDERGVMMSVLVGRRCRCPPELPCQAHAAAADNCTRSGETPYSDLGLL